MAKSNSNKYHIFDTINAAFGPQLVERYGKVLKHISNFINYRSEVLDSKDVGARLLYQPSVENDFYDACGIDREWVKDVIKGSSELPGAYLINDPKKQFYHLYLFLQALSAIYYNADSELINKYYSGKENYTRPYLVIELYFTIRLYSLQQLRIFQHQPNKNIMEYTINNLSARFDLATYPNLFSVFEKYVETNTKSMEFDRGRPSDKMMIEYVNKMNNRIKMFLKSLFVEFMRNYNNNLSSGVQELEATNDEGKQFLLVADNVSSTIEIASRKILNNFIQDKFINEKLLNIACRNSGNPSKAKAKIVIQKIRDSKDEKMLLDIIMCIVSYWLISMKQDINTLHSKQFITTCSAAYAISNTNDKYIIRLKSVLEEMILKYANDIVDTERKATLLSFKKCIHIYMVLYIASVN